MKWSSWHSAAGQRLATVVRLPERDTFLPRQSRPWNVQVTSHAPKGRRSGMASTEPPPSRSPCSEAYTVCIVSRGLGGRILHQRCINNVPFSKTCHAVFQVTPSLELGICHADNVNVGQRMAEKSPQVLRERAKGIVTALEVVCQKRLDSSTGYGGEQDPSHLTGISSHSLEVV